MLFTPFATAFVMFPARALQSSWSQLLQLYRHLWTCAVQVFDTAEQELAATGQPSSSRGCKYALNTLMQTFQLKTMAASVAAGPVSFANNSA